MDPHSLHSATRLIIIFLTLFAKEKLSHSLNNNSCDPLSALLIPSTELYTKLCIFFPYGLESQLTLLSVGLDLVYFEPPKNRQCLMQFITTRTLSSHTYIRIKHVFSLSLTLTDLAMFVSLSSCRRLTFSEFLM